MNSPRRSFAGTLRMAGNRQGVQRYASDAGAYTLSFDEEVFAGARSDDGEQYSVDLVGFGSTPRPGTNPAWRMPMEPNKPLPGDFAASMTPPNMAFPEPYVTAQNAPYFLANTNRRVDSSGGVLKNGKTVWLAFVLDRLHSTAHVLGFVKDVGVIYVSPMWLRRSNREPSSKAEPIKPEEFANSFVVMQSATYQVVEADGSTSSMKTGGLDVGQVVYLPKPEDVKDLGQAHVLAYADGIGHLSISRNVLAHS